MQRQYTPNSERYERMQYARCGASGLFLPKIALGLWQNFGTYDSYERAEDMVHYAFDSGVTYFDLANNYGPEPGSAEQTFGRILADSLGAYRDELIIASKAGHEMWEGPYGGNSSRKNIIASADQSLRRTGLEYFDIFYTHRFDGVTPIEETAQALTDLVRSGKALYVGISKYPPAEAQLLYDLLAEAKTPAVVAQYRYSLLDRSIESFTLPVADENGAAIVAFSPLAQGLLSDRYIAGIPDGSRAAGSSDSLSVEGVESRMEAVVALNEVAKQRGETLAQMALAWAVRDGRVASLVMGASSIGQIAENLGALGGAPFSEEELAAIDEITLYL